MQTFRFRDWFVMEQHSLAQFTQALLQNRFDSAQYLVFADWLEERGDPLSELIRIAVAMHDTPDKTQKQTLFDRYEVVLGQVGQELSDQHGIKALLPRIIRWDYVPAGKKRKVHASLIVRHGALQYSAKGEPDYKNVEAASLPEPMQRAIVLNLLEQVFTAGGDRHFPFGSGRPQTLPFDPSLSFSDRVFTGAVLDAMRNLWSHLNTMLPRQWNLPNFIPNLLQTTESIVAELEHLAKGGQQIARTGRVQQLYTELISAISELLGTYRGMLGRPTVADQAPQYYLRILDVLRKLAGQTVTRTS